MSNNWGTFCVVQRHYQSKLYDDGVVLYLDDSGDTISLDHTSFSVLNAVSNKMSTYLEILEFIASSPLTNTACILAEELPLYIDALISKNLVIACKP